MKAHDGPETVRFRNGSRFNPKNVELETISGEGPVSLVYTNNPVIKAAYERLNGTEWKGRILDIEVKPIAAPSGPVRTEAELMEMSVPELVEEFGVSPTRRGRTKADIVAEILEG